MTDEDTKRAIASAFMAMTNEQIRQAPTSLLVMSIATVASLRCLKGLRLMPHDIDYTLVTEMIGELDARIPPREETP